MHLLRGDKAKAKAYEKIAKFECNDLKLKNRQLQTKVKKNENQIEDLADEVCE